MFVCVRACDVMMLLLSLLLLICEEVNELASMEKDCAHASEHQHSLLSGVRAFVRSFSRSFVCGTVACCGAGKDDTAVTAAAAVCLSSMVPRVQEPVFQRRQRLFTHRIYSVYSLLNRKHTDRQKIESNRKKFNPHR